MTQIIEGVKEAQSIAKKSGAVVAPPSSNYSPVKVNGVERTINNVDFEVALTSESKSEKDGKIGVMFGLVSLAGGGKSGTGDKAITSIKFSVPVAFPLEEGPR